MKLHLKHTGIDITPSFAAYIEEKIGGLGRFLKREDETGAVELWIEVARTTRHHHKGDVFRAEADLRLPGKILRGEAVSFDARAAVDAVRSKLQSEIERYKVRRGAPRPAGRKRS